MPRWFKIALSTATVAVICFGVFNFYLEWSFRNMDWNIPVYKEFSARDALLVDLSHPDCLSRETVIAEAQSRRWGAEDATSLGQCSRLAGVSDWLKVTTEDGLLLPENPENATYFGFDENSCSVYLPANAGIGDTCPEALDP